MNTSKRGRVFVPAFVLSLLSGTLLVGCPQPPKPPELSCGSPAPEPQAACPLLQICRPSPKLPAVVLPPEARAGERAVSLGKSVRGEELKMYVLGDGGEVTFIVGGIHGDEPGGAGLAQCFLEYLRANPLAYKGRTVAVFARANPDGLAANTRVNAHGVDVNRSFPASNWKETAAAARYNGGGAPAAEPETKAIIQAVESLHPTRIISIHSISGGKQCNNWDGPAEALARRMAGRNGYPPKATIGYPTPGSMGTWAGIDHKIAMVTLELPVGVSTQECWRNNQAALLEAVK
jgi:predicted deacylase